MNEISRARILMMRSKSGQPVYKGPTSLMRWVQSCNQSGCTRNRNRSKGCKNKSTVAMTKITQLVLLKSKIKNDLHPLCGMTV
ncbi:hypothetical protein DFH28DRAFT_898263 [Melampsora americana]|nr:hypothetical protein DFH28DRAFT_898263 [Melampsora americana]